MAQPLSSIKVSLLQANFWWFDWFLMRFNGWSITRKVVRTIWVDVGLEGTGAIDSACHYSPPGRRTDTQNNNKLNILIKLLQSYGHS